MLTAENVLLASQRSIPPAELEKANAWLREELRTCVTPPPRITNSQWADAHRVISQGKSSEPGRWRTDRTPYLRELMDVADDPRVHTIVGMKPARMGFTEVLINTILRHIASDPAPIMYVQQTVEMAETFSKAMLWPAIRDTPVVADIIASARSRDSSHTILHKEFPGGDIGMVGANSPRGFRMVAKKIIMCDDVDGFEQNVGDEGDAIDLAIRRADSFPDKKIWIISSPTIKGVSRVEAAWEESDKRRYHVPCPRCGYEQTLNWGQLKFVSRHPIKAEYECSDCHALLGHREKMGMLRQGRWIATAPFAGIAGFHLNKLYSPFVTWDSMAEEWLRAKDTPERLQVFVNTALAETYDTQAGEKVDAHALASRRESYGPALPESVVLLTAGVDVQQDRLEVEVVGWGRQEESWGIERRVFRGDLTNIDGDAWTALAQFLDKTYEHPVGTPLRISGTCVDTGYNTKEVYSWVQKQRRGGLFATKGASAFGAPPFMAPNRSQKTATRIYLYIVGVSSLKLTLFERLKKTLPGPGYLHFPESYTEEFFTQLTSEKLVTKMKAGFPRREFIAEGRNEALDCRILAMAALGILGWDLAALADTIERKLETPVNVRHKVTPRQEPPKQDTDAPRDTWAQRTRPRGGWFSR